MATFYSNLTSSAVEEVHTRVSGLLAGGQLRMARATYVMTAGTDESASDFINLVSLPVGAVVLPHLSWVYHEDLGTALTFDVGDTADPNRYALSITCGTNAGTRPFIASGDATLPAACIAPYTIEEANRMIIADLTTVTAPTAGQSIVFCIAYHAQI